MDEAQPSTISEHRPAALAMIERRLLASYDRAVCLSPAAEQLERHWTRAAVTRKLETILAWRDRERGLEYALVSPNSDGGRLPARSHQGKATETMTALAVDRRLWGRD
jgi:hypothetical protein